MAKVVIFLTSLVAFAYGLPQHYFTGSENPFGAVSVDLGHAPIAALPRAAEGAKKTDILEYTWQQTQDGGTNYS